MKNAKYWIDRLGLKVLPVEGGWYREVWRSGLEIPGSVLPAQYGGGRSACSLIYYLLQGGEVSRWHKLISPEIWVWHCGGTLVQTLGGSGAAPAESEVRIIGAAEGASLQSLVPPGTWQTTKIREGDFALVSCIVSPAFVPEDFFLPQADL